MKIEMIRILKSWIIVVATMTIMSCHNLEKSETVQVVAADTVAVSVAAADTITIAMTGDVMFGTTYPEVKLPTNGGRNLFDHVASIIGGADVAVGNLECVISDTAAPRPKRPGKYTFFFRSPTSGAKLLNDAGYDFMSMANNHAYDFLEEGIASSKENLEKYGIGHAGTIGDEHSIKTIDGVKYGFVAFGHSTSTLHTYDTLTVQRIIREVRPQVDVLIVSFHGGAEGAKYAHLPYGNETFVGDFRGDSRKFSHMAIDLGADVVFGHGPHVVRAMELYKGHLIAYSLGNFCTPGGINVAGKNGYAPVLEVKINRETGEFIEGKIHSFIQQWRMGPQPDKNNRAASEIRALTRSDIKNPGITIGDDGSILRN